MQQDLDALAVLAKTDPQARAELSRILYAILRTHFTRRMRIPRLAAEDLAQSTIAILLSKLDSFEVRHPGSFMGFVFRVATCHAKNQQRKWSNEAKHRVELQSWSLRDRAASMTSELSLRERLEVLREVIAEAGSTTRRTIEGWAESEAWQVLVEREGVKRSTLRARVHRVIKRLRERLRERAPGMLPESSSAS